MFYSDSKFKYSREELIKLRTEIIDRCSEIIHHDYEGTCGPNCRDSLKIRNYIHFRTSKSDGLYRFVYEEYKFPYLVSLIDRILKYDFSALDEILNINYDKELKPISEKIRVASLELDEIDNLNIRAKRDKLSELESYILQMEYNRKQESVFPYYDKVLHILGESLIRGYCPKLVNS